MFEPKLIVVGAGFFGLTIAERVANELGLEVLVLERRNHLGGNAFSYIDEDTGIEVHKYGSHLFHTSNEKVWAYIQRFTNFNSYKHTVYSRVGGRLVSMPINLMTINQVFGGDYSPDEARRLIAKEIESESGAFAKEENLEAKAINSVGRTLYESLIKGYTENQWQNKTSRIACIGHFKAPRPVQPRQQVLFRCI